ncbi:MAG: hypothetical protein ACFFDF_07665 [Candidatus Odinarchaeota archaeon]
MSKEKFVRDKPHVSIGILIALFSVFSGFSLGIVIYNDVMKTSDSDGDSIPDDIEARTEVPLYLDVSDNLLTFSSFESGTSTTSTGHELGHNLGISHGFSTPLEIFSSLYSDTSTGIPILEFGIKFESLIEFLDLDSNGYFEPAVDVILGQTALNNLSRIEFGFGVDGQPSYYAGYLTSNGMLSIDFYRSRENVLLSRGIGLVAPNELKSILTFTNYVPLTGGARVALNLSLTSSHNLIFSNSTFSVKASTSNYEVKYEWFDWNVLSETGNKINITIPSSPIPSKEGLMYINFGHVINGSYDPKLSWVLPYRSMFNFFDLPWSYIAMGSIGLLMVATTTHVVRKKPGRLKYSPPSSSSESNSTSTGSEKKIPSTLKHRDR